MSVIDTDGEELVIDYGELRGLVVDDFPGMRSALKLTLSNFGMTRIEVVSSATEAIYKVQNKAFDLILCDYNLGDGRDGQQLLEELRYRSLIPLETVFIMVTAESSYEAVVATAELAPDDYMIKPFSSEAVRNRLDVILTKKLIFSKIYKRYQKEDLEGAIQACDEVILKVPRYVVDAMRFKGELLNALGRFPESEALYRRIIDMRAIPWARLGLANSLHHQKKDRESARLLRDLIAQNPQLVAAYDLLSDVCVSLDDKSAAQEALERGVEVSARTVRRQQKLGDLAYENGDVRVAHEAYKQTLEKGKNSIFVTSSDYANMCRVQVDTGDLAGALETLRKGQHVLKSTVDGQLINAVAKSMIFSKMGDTGEAEKALNEAARLRKAGARADNKVLLDFADACMSNGEYELADQAVREVAHNAHDSEVLLNKARRIYSEANRGDVGEMLLEQESNSIQDQINEAVILAHKKQYREAVEKLLAVRLMAPHNPRVLMNTVWTIIRCIEREGVDHNLLDDAHGMLREVERIVPGHIRLPLLRGELQEMEARFGIRRMVQ